MAECLYELVQNYHHDRRKLVNTFRRLSRCLLKKETKNTKSYDHLKNSIYKKLKQMDKILGKYCNAEQ